MQVTLSGKKILITGGTSVLGRAFVRQAVSEGAVVFFTYHQNETTAEELQKLGAHGFRVNLRSRPEIDQLKNQIKAQSPALDCIIHNAASVKDHTLQNMTEEEWDEVLSIDLDAAYYVSKKFLSLLFKSTSGRIIHVISRVGYKGGFGQANYAAAKGGLIALTKSLAKELGKKQILVNAFNPGFMMSKMTESLPPEVIEHNKTESVLQKISDPEAAARFLVFLLSDSFQGVSGQIFHYDSRPA